MAELIGAADIRVDMPTDDARRAVRQFTRDANRRLKRLQRDIAAATAEMTALQQAAGDVKVKTKVTGTGDVAAARQAISDLKDAAGKVKVKVTLDDQAGSGLAAATTAITDLRTAAAKTIKVKLKVTGTADVTAATQSIRDLKTAARNTKVKVTLDDQTGPGVTAVNTAIANLQAAAANITVTLDDQTATDIATITAALTALAATTTEVKVTLDDQTATGIAAVTTALTTLGTQAVEVTVKVKDNASTKLDTLSVKLADFRTAAANRIDIEVQVTGNPAEITAAATALRSLRTAATSAGTALQSLTTRSAGAALALTELVAAARDASNALENLRDKIRGVSSALRSLRTSIAQTATSLRDLARRAETADDRIDRLGDRTLRLSGDMDNLGGSVDNTNRALRDLRDGLPGLTGGMRGLSGASGGGGGGGRGSGVAGALGSVAVAAAAAAAAVGAAVPAVAGIGAALAAVAPAAGVAATGILTAITAGAALKIGLQGVGDALKVAFDPEKAEEFNKAMKNLAPSARRFVEAIKGAEPAFKELRLDVQGRLFAGFGKGLESTGKTLLPTLRKSLVQAAGSLNAMGRGVLTTAKSLGKSGALGAALKGANQGLKDFEALPATIVQGLVQIAAAAAPAFNRLTGAAQGGINLLSKSIAKAFESGAMEDAISRAASLARDLGAALGNVGRTIGNVLGAADASGAGLIQNFKAITAELAKLTAGAGVQDGLRTLFETMGTVGRTATRLLGEGIKGVAPVITALGPPVQALVRNLGAGLTPVIRSLSPILVSLATNVGRVITAFAPLLAVAGQLVSGALKGLAPVLDAVGEQVALLAESAAALLGPALRQLPAFVNPLLGLFGKLASTLIALQNDVLTAMQPALQQVGAALGNVFKAVAPLVGAFADLAGFGLRGFVAAAQPVIAIAGKIATVLAGKLAAALNHLAAWIEDHRGTIEAVFRQGERAILAFAVAVVAAMPEVFAAFRTLALTAIAAFEVIAEGSVKLFGWIPGVGDRVRSAAENFLNFSKIAKQGLDKAAKEVNDFSRNATPKLQNKQLRMDIRDWQAKIAEAKRQLDDKNLPKEKRAKLKADIKQWQDNVRKAQRQIDGVKGVARKITVTSNAKGVAGSAQGAIKAVKDRNPKITVSSNAGRVAGAARGAIQSVKDRRPRITVTTNAGAVAGAVRGAIRSIPDENVYINVQRRGLGAVGRPLATGGLVGYANGGPIRGFPSGGLIRGRGTDTSDSNLIAASKNEFVIRAAAVRKYGVDFFERLNAMRAPAMAAGGRVRAAFSGGVGGDMTGAGVDLGRGLIGGLRSMLGPVGEVARSLAAAAVTATESALGISSPSRVFAKIGRDTGSGFIKGLTGTKSKIDQTADRIAASITSAFRGRRSRTDDRLVALVQRGNKKLQSLAGQRDAIAKKIADAQKFATDLAAKARSTGSLASIVKDDFFAPQYVEKRMRASLASVKAFTANVQKLQKKGLSKALLRQILEMGPEQGGAFAKALAGADAATIKRYNKLQAELDKRSTRLGRIGADLLYDSGKKAGDGFLAGLKGQQKAIEKLMLSIAKGMQRSIRRALGIRSPSRVMAEVGRQSGQGLVIGLVRQIPAVDGAMGQVSRAIAGGVNTPRMPGRPGRAGQAPQPVGASGRAVHYHFHNEGVIGSRREVENWLVASFDQLRRQRRLPAGA